MCAILVLNRLVMVTWMSQNCTSLGIDVSQIDHRMEKKFHNLMRLSIKLWQVGFFHSKIQVED